MAAVLVVLFSFTAGAADDDAVDKTSTLADSTNPVLLPGIVVEANRVPLTLFQIPTAAHIIYLDDHKRHSLSSVGELAGRMPGLRSYSTGNVWGQRDVDVRGFYGAGQAQYLLVTYDGIPLNNISSGLVNFNDLELADIGRVESIGGPVSAQYGDFGFGGMLALYSNRGPAAPLPKLTIISGSDDAFGLNAQMTREVGSWRLFGSASRRTNQGWRKHSKLESQKLFMKATNSFGERNSLGIIVSIGKSEEENPGAMTAATMAEDRAGVALDPAGSPRQDKTDIDEILAAVTSTIAIGDNLELRPQVYYKSSKGDNIVTITSSMIHRPKVTSTGAEISAGLKKELFGRELKLVVGGGVEYGRLETLYSDFVSPIGGSPVDISGGKGTRLLGSAYLHGIFYLSDPVYVAFGGRIDHVDTEFEERQAAASTEGEKYSQNDFAFTPKFALGISLTDKISGYASVSGAFKAPTLVHLYDSPPYFVFEPPGTFYYLPISNHRLESMNGTNYEIGLKFADRERLFASLSLFSYRIKDEIDFALATLSYANIGRSRHNGVEAVLNGRIINDLSTHLSVAYSEATFRSGEFNGKQLNGVPKYTYRGQLKYSPGKAASFALDLSGLKTEYLDQANGIPLGDHTVAAVSAGFTFQHVTLGARVDNLLDKEYNVSGYFDPVSNFPFGVTRFVPAPGRTFQISLSTDF